MVFLKIALLALSCVGWTNAYAVTYTITNNTSLQHCAIKVMQNNSVVGSVAQGETKTFSVDLSAQIGIQMLDYSWGTTDCKYGLSTGSVGYQNNTTSVGQGTSVSGHKFCQTVTMTDSKNKTIVSNKKVCDGQSVSGAGGQYNVITVVTGS